MGDLKKQSVMEIWNGEAYQEMRRQIVVQDFRDCPNCPYLNKALTSRMDPFSETLNLIEDRVTRSGRAVDEGRHHWREFKFHLKRAVKGDGDRGEHVSRGMGNALGVVGGFLRGAWRSVYGLHEQKQINQQLLQMLRISLERQERSREDLELLTEAKQLQGRLLAGDREAAGNGRHLSLDQRMNGLFYGVEFLEDETPVEMKVGEQHEVRLVLVNRSAVIWPTRGEQCVNLSYSLVDGQGNLRQLDGLRTELPEEVRPHVPLR